MNKDSNELTDGEILMKIVIPGLLRNLGIDKLTQDPDRDLKIFIDILKKECGYLETKTSSRKKHKLRSGTVQKIFYRTLKVFICEISDLLELNGKLSKEIDSLKIDVANLTKSKHDFENQISYLEEQGKVLLKKVALIKPEIPFSEIEKETQAVLDLKKALNVEIKTCGLSPLLKNCLLRGNIYTLNDLIKSSSKDVKKIRGFGKKCMKELEIFMTSQNLIFEGKI